MGPTLQVGKLRPRREASHRACRACSRGSKPARDEVPVPRGGGVGRQSTGIRSLGVTSGRGVTVLRAGPSAQLPSALPPAPCGCLSSLVAPAHTCCEPLILALARPSDLRAQREALPPCQEQGEGLQPSGGGLGQMPPAGPTQGTQAHDQEAGQPHGVFRVKRLLSQCHRRTTDST